MKMSLFKEQISNMRFKEFLLETLCILESGNTRAKNVWIEKKDNSTTMINFIIGDKQIGNDIYGIQVYRINKNTFIFPEALERFKKFNIINVIFGPIKNDGTINVERVQHKNPASGLKILFAAKNVIADYVNQADADLVIFSAKRGFVLNKKTIRELEKQVKNNEISKTEVDSQKIRAEIDAKTYEQRKNVYGMLANIEAKHHSFWKKEYEDATGFYFILGKQTLKVSKEEEKALEKEVIAKTTFMDKIKK